jgi:hypothetical protein
MWAYVRFGFGAIRRLPPGLGGQHWFKHRDQIRGLQVSSRIAARKWRK